VNTLASVAFLLYFLLVLCGFGSEALRLLRRRSAQRRRARLLAEYMRALLAEQEKLRGYADLSRFVTANMLLAAHRESHEGVRAQA
jgi:hypothetical protein